MFFTGGTTGLPKGADHRHRNLMAFCYGVAALWPMPLDAERMLNVAPLFHIWGFCYTLVFPVYLRAFMDLLPAYKPAAVLEEFQKRRITTFAGGPAALYMGLRANENFDTTDFSSLRVCLSGGAACPVELIRFWEEKTGSVLLEGWGMSEGAPIHQNPLDGVRKVGSVGLAAAGYDAEVVDLETGTRVMPTGERGEIRVRGPQFTEGYHNRPEENARQIRDGWLYTGDIGYYDEDGYMFLVDRKKEMIIVGGYNVYPREIDELLFKHPAILEAATVGVPDSFSGEAVKAFVVLKPGMSAERRRIARLSQAEPRQIQMAEIHLLRRRAATLRRRQDRQARAEGGGLIVPASYFAAVILPGLDFSKSAIGGTASFAGVSASDMAAMATSAVREKCALSRWIAFGASLDTTASMIAWCSAMTSRCRLCFPTARTAA